MNFEQQRMEAWDRFATAALKIEFGLGTDPRFAAEYADWLLKERDKRFPVPKSDSTIVEHGIESISQCNRGHIFCEECKSTCPVCPSP